jgi:hypothetical protein
MSGDIAVGTFSGPLPTGAPVARKPSYLITLEDTSGKTKTLKRFITIDKPELLSGFIQVKGLFSEEPEEDISKKFTDILTNAPKDLFLEMMFPWHKICSVRSLVFKAK